MAVPIHPAPRACRFSPVLRFRTTVTGALAAASIGRGGRKRLPSALAAQVAFTLENPVSKSGLGMPAWNVAPSWTYGDASRMKASARKSA